MRQAFAIIGLQFRMTYKSKALLIMMFGMPLLFSVIFGLGLGGSDSNATATPIAVIDEDHSAASARLTEMLKTEKMVRVTTSDRDGMKQLFADKKAVAAVVIPADFEQSLSGQSAPEVQMIVTPGGTFDVALSPTVSRLTSRVASDFRLARRVAGANAPADAVAKAYDRIAADRKASAVTVVAESVQRPGKTGTSVSGASLGFTVMFVMMLVFMQGGTILQERQNGTWGRILTTPVAKLWVLFGYVASFFVAGLVQFAGLVVLSRVLFKADWGPWLPLLALAAVFILCCAGLGLFVAGLVKTAEQQRTIGMIIVVASSMLGGVYWPLELMSPTMQRIGYMTPQAWAMAGFREVMLRGGSWSGIAWPMAVLAGLTLVFMTAGLFRVRFE